MNRCAVAYALAAGLLLSPPPAAAQCLPGPPGEEVSCPLDAPRWVGHFTTLSANALIGGVTAGVAQHLRGGSFARGFTTGVLGGGVTYAGKWVAAQRFSGAGLLGREVSAVGVSMVRNAANGAGVLHELVLPMGPLRLYVRPREPKRSAVRLDATATGWLIYGIAERELRLDAGASISAGAPVFRTHDRILQLGDDSTHAAGLANSGVIFLADVPAYGSEFTRRALAHERVHVLQQDQLFALWTDRAEEWLLQRMPGGNVVVRYVDVNASTQLLHILGRLVAEHADRPWELESIFLAR